MKLFLKLLPILGITFIDIFGFSILIPIVPLFAKFFGASDLTAGLLFSAYSAFQFLAGPIWGRVSDLIGRYLRSHPNDQREFLANHEHLLE